MKKDWTALLGALVLASAALAQQPRVINGKLEVHPVSGGLAATLRQMAGAGDRPLWIGYAVPAHGSQPRLICCFDSSDFKAAGCCSGCRLESSNGNSFNSDGGTCVEPGPPSHVFVLLRFLQGEVTRVQLATPDCGLDARDATLHWLADVRPPESIAYLAGLAGPKKHLAVAAIAMHDDPAADAALDRLAAADQPEKTRSQAAFWMASERGRHGFETLRRLARQADDGRFRHHLTFAFSVSDEPEAVQELIRMAHEDPAGEVRGQALFWLAQKAGKKVAGEISAAIDDDPETDVKKKAVFALSQMPDGEGVPKLLELARKHRNPAVRKAAVFWLGQSHDPRALAFIEGVLSR